MGRRAHARLGSAGQSDPSYSIMRPKMPKRICVTMPQTSLTVNRFFQASQKIVERKERAICSDNRGYTRNASVPFSAFSFFACASEPFFPMSAYV